MNILNNKLSDIVEKDFITGYRAYDVCRKRNSVLQIRAINDPIYEVTKHNNVYYNEESINGQKIPYIYGDINSFIEFPNIITYNNKYSICAITRYNGDDITKKNNILTITNINKLITSIGHNNNWAGIIDYNNSSSNLVKKSNTNYNNNWVVSCISYDSSSSNLFNGEAYIGSKNDPSGSINTGFNDINAIIGNININTFNNADKLNSSWALSHLLVWDIALSSEKLKNVYNACIDYLSNPAKNDIILYKTIYPRFLPNCIESFYNNLKNSLNISKPLWAGYYAGNYNNLTNELPDFNGNPERNIKSNMIKNVKFNNTSPIPFLYGGKDSYIIFPDKSINSDFTICAITKYTSTNEINNNMILQSIDNNINNDFYHGHYNNKKGVISYNNYEFTKGFPSNTPINSWVVSCAKNTNSTNPAEHVIINGFNSGLIIEQEYTQNNSKRPVSTLTINYNKDINYNNNSEWALSYLLIWDSHLSDIDLKNVSIALNQFLEKGETLSFMNSNNQIIYSSTLLQQQQQTNQESTSQYNQYNQYNQLNLTEMQKKMLGII